LSLSDDWPQLSFSSVDKFDVARLAHTPTAVVLKSTTGTGTVRIAPRLQRNQAVVEQIDSAGGITQIRMTTIELRRYAAALMKIAAAIENTHTDEDSTQP
jgi:hypothetical protein